MILRLFGLKRPSDTVVRLYDSIVRQSRHPAFYTDFGVPDTVDGRFDMQVVHAFLVMRHLRAGAQGETAQALFDHFFQDMDRTIREMGVSDLKVPKKIRTMVEAFYGRCKAYEEALDSDDGSLLSGALARNLAGETGPPVDAERLAKYMRATDAALTRLPGATLETKDVNWPNPAQIDLARTAHGR